MKRLLPALGLVAAALGLLACGSSGGDLSTNAASEHRAEETQAANPEATGKHELRNDLNIKADPNHKLSYVIGRGRGVVKAGAVTINFGNQTPVVHDVVVENSKGRIVGRTPRIAESTISVGITLPPGRYTFYCSVPGHRQAGMEGSIVAK